jgi:hypothetical protein
MIGRVVHGQAGVPEKARSRTETWIIVCEHFHGALGPVPNERLADELAALASGMGGCTYRPVRLTLAPVHAARRAVHKEPTGNHEACGGHRCRSRSPNDEEA